MHNTILSSALDYYAQQGAALLSFNAGEKGPKYDDWHDKTSRDPVQWAAWHAAGFNIGVHSGNSNWIVVDGDTKGEGGADGAFKRWADLCRANGDDANKYPAQVRSRSGGFHIYFKAPAGVTLTRRTPVADVELRAGRHQTVVPPSQVEGLPYSFYADPQPPYPAPQWMIDICAMDRVVATGGTVRLAPIGLRPLDGTQAAQVLATACKKVATAESNRNIELNKQAFVVGKYVGNGEIGVDVAVHDLLGACETNGLLAEDGEDQCRKTIYSGMPAGAKSPARTAADMFDGALPIVASPPLAARAPVVRNAATLLGRKFAPVRYIVPGYLAEGCTILAGKPKVGKSWFVLDAALAVSGGNGGQMFGKSVEQGDVLYLALEDNERRLQSRIRKVLGPFASGPERLEYHTEWKRYDDGGVADVEAWIKAKPKPTLIIVDVLQRIRAANVNNQNAYASDYETVAALQRLASQHNVAVVVVHHLRKSAADNDPFDKISGTLGLSGAADSILILDRDGQGVTLYGRGRDIEEIETAVQFDKGRCRWTVLGSAPEVRRSDERKAILDVLATGTSMAPADIAAATGMPSNNVRRLLFKMARTGEVSKIGTGYVSETTPSTPGNAGNGNAHRQPIILPPPPY